MTTLTAAPTFTESENLPPKKQRSTMKKTPANAMWINSHSRPRNWDVEMRRGIGLSMASNATGIRKLFPVCPGGDCWCRECVMKIMESDGDAAIAYARAARSFYLKRRHIMQKQKTEAKKTKIS